MNMNMNMNEQLNQVSDLLADAICSVKYCAYNKLNDEEKEEAKKRFFNNLKSNNVIITLDLADKAEETVPDSPMAAFLRQYYVTEQSIFSEAVNQLTKGRTESLKIIHKPKRKKSLYYNLILPGNSLLVFDGWLDIDAEALIYNTTKETKDIVVKKSKYSSFDNNYINDVRSLVNEKPIFCKE